MRDLLDAFPSLRNWKPSEFLGTPMWRGKVDIDYEDLLLSGLPDDCRVLFLVADDDYQGDTRLLLQCGERLAISIFGWGSCTGCDVLQQCENLDDLEGLRQEMVDALIWQDSAAEMLVYFREHDWEGDFGGRSDGQRQFVFAGRAFLEELARHTAPVGSGT